ncbi:MAG: hypothetical protein JXA99_02860 [Candidatus Lokiarchaeota archaeon]|nr:hypothetical protein [Candidatus Lokiarchaeota archaeon]
MSKKIYICNECGYHFPSQLSGLIENNVRVFCEKCGTPFNISGINFTERKFKPEKKTERWQKWENQKKYTYSHKKTKSYPSLYNAIQRLNDFSYIPLLVVSIFSIALSLEYFFNPIIPWYIYLIRQSLLGIFGILIALYDKIIIKKKIKEGDLGSVIVHSFWIGILGSFVYGAGFFITLKGILIFFYIILTRERNKKGTYRIFLYIKNSFNQFSSLIGFILFLYIGYTFFNEGTYLQIQAFIEDFINNIKDIDIEQLKNVIINNIFIVIGIGLFVLATIFLIIDYAYRDSIQKIQTCDGVVALRTFIFGIIATCFFSVGIFILLKAITMYILIIIKPTDYKEEKLPTNLEPSILAQGEKKEQEIIKKDQTSIPIINPYKITQIKEKPIESKKEDIQREIVKIKEESTLRVPDIKEKQIKELKKSEEIVSEKEEKEFLKQKEEDIELKLHESILPVKNEKDQKLVKEYFSKIFNLLSNDIREKIKKLNIPKNEKEELLKELAFLTKEQQVKYIDAIINLYQEKIPRILVEKIRKLPNVKPEQYKKIIEQLKYMDSEEQYQFVEFLEKHA